MNLEIRELTTISKEGKQENKYQLVIAKDLKIRGPVKKYLKIEGIERIIGGYIEPKNINSQILIDFIKYKDKNVIEVVNVPPLQDINKCKAISDFDLGLIVKIVDRDKLDIKQLTEKQYTGINTVPGYKALMFES
jgi:hypothetical protein